jgi:hypothetical protein
VSLKARVILAAIAVALAGGVALLVAMRSYEHTSWAELGRAIDEVRPQDDFELASSTRDAKSCGTSTCDTRRLIRRYVTPLDPVTACEIALVDFEEAPGAIDVKHATPQELDPGQSCEADAIVQGRYMTLLVFTSSQMPTEEEVPPGVTVLSINVFE